MKKILRNMCCLTALACAISLITPGVFAHLPNGGTHDDINVTLIYPTSGDSFLVGDAINISANVTWEALTPDTVILYRSLDGGSTWIDDGSAMTQNDTQEDFWYHNSTYTVEGTYYMEIGAFGSGVDEYNETSFIILIITDEYTTTAHEDMVTGVRSVRPMLYMAIPFFIAMYIIVWFFTIFEKTSGKFSKRL